jgi:DNA replication and repair protein RecF
MHLKSLRIDNLRLIERLDLPLDSRWNLLTGANGAGKTTVLEAAFLLSHGRSFRSGSRDALNRQDTSGYAVFGELVRESGTVRVGLARGVRSLEARLDGEAAAIGDLLHHTAVLCFEPGSHALIAGQAEERRRFLDWGVFHVEPDFLPAWRRYQRVLKQRNVLLRSQQAGELPPWDRELDLAAMPLLVMRQRYVDKLRPAVLGLLTELLPELGAAQLAYTAGFDTEQRFADVLAHRRERDLSRGHTGAGPHRADWSIAFPAAPRREHLSRGQEKLCAFAFVIAQARLFAAHSGEWPVLCLDDVASEVDAEHQDLILRVVDASGAQVLATGTETPAGLARLRAPVARFHVEQGRVTRLL